MLGKTKNNKNFFFFSAFFIHFLSSYTGIESEQMAQVCSLVLMYREAFKFVKFSHITSQEIENSKLSQIFKEMQYIIVALLYEKPEYFL